MATLNPFFGGDCNPFNGFIGCDSTDSSTYRTVVSIYQTEESDVVVVDQDTVAELTPNSSVWLNLGVQCSTEGSDDVLLTTAGVQVRVEYLLTDGSLDPSKPTQLLKYVSTSQESHGLVGIAVEDASGNADPTEFVLGRTTAVVESDNDTEIFLTLRAYPYSGGGAKHFQRASFLIPLSTALVT